MDLDLDGVEIVDSEESITIIVSGDECIVTEVDDLGFSEDDGMILEEIEVEDSAEEGESDAKYDVSFSDPEIEEPEDGDVPVLDRTVVFTFHNKPIEFRHPPKYDTTLKELFAMTRRELEDICGDDELWFRFNPAGLEVGEENAYIQEPTMAHLLKMLGKDDPVNVEVENRVSFYSKFKDLLNSLDLNDVDISEAPKKKARKD